MHTKVTWLVDPREFPTHLYSIACMTLAVAMVLVDLAICRCSRPRRVRFDPDQDGTGQITVGISISTTISLRTAAIVFITLLGVGTLAYIFNQCGVGFLFADCWMSVCGGRQPCNDWMMTVLRIYLVTKCVFVTGQVVYFWMLTISNTALFSKSRFNMLMAHHVMATTLYLCMRTAVEYQTYKHDTSFQNCENYTCSLDGYTFWAESYFPFEGIFGTIEFNPFVTVLGLLFVAYYFDVWKTYRQNSNRGWRSRTVSASGSGFHQLLRLFTDHLRDEAMLARTIALSLLFFGYVAAATLSLSFSLGGVIFPSSALLSCHSIAGDISCRHWSGDIT